jgi:hypothetical protein
MPILTAAQRSDVGGQFVLTREFGIVGQHRNHSHTDGEGFRQFPAYPVGRVVDSTPPNRVGGGQPARSDHRQQY